MQSSGEVGLTGDYQPAAPLANQIKVPLQALVEGGARTCDATRARLTVVHGFLFLFYFLETRVALQCLIYADVGVAGT